MTDLRSALEEAFSNDSESEAAPSVENTPTTEPATTEAAPSTEPANSGRDEKGRFSAKPVEPAPQSEPTTPVETPPVRKAPSSWKPAAQEAFLKADRGEQLTPEEIKLLTAEAERRESDFHRGLNDFKSHSERAKQYDAVLAPYQNHLRNLGVDAPTAINALMQADVKLRTSDPSTKAQYFAQLAQEYGIDLNQVRQPQPQDPQTQYLMQQLNELRQSHQMWQNQMQQQEQLKAQQELQSFSSNGKPHFDLVRNEMADLLETGKATSLQDAYEMAVWMKPEVRQTLISEQLAEVQRKATEQAQSQRAKTAAVSVKGSNPSGGVSQQVTGSVRDILSAQFDNG
jgi:hypothetical protein